MANQTKYNQILDALQTLLAKKISRLSPSARLPRLPESGKAVYITISRPNPQYWRP